MDRLRIIGTSHIARESKAMVKRTVSEWQPDIIAVELDQRRLYSLLSRQKRTRFSLYSVRRVGLVGFLFAAIGSWATQKLGRIVSMEPGAEMLEAVRLARKGKKELRLIDQDIEITLKRFSHFLTWKERRNFAADVLKGLFRPRKELEKLGIKSIDLSKVPADGLIESLISRLKDRYPNVYRVLVEERNIVMASRLGDILEKNPGKKVLAVVGAGHRKGMLEILGSAGTAEDSPDRVSISYSVSLGNSPQ